ncbi:hypothetical protein HU200_043729 [Digitaria exilis]|uniref:Uncharacterized protein n=1 Tax=Digitaria exilis TaxID=1010633 RepID=A0A835BAG3_9POAL|nr:hypothetical protein HU200_043729 [Digitaria exilis]CAB3448633.1 unnamed protein product [Digitaria exilis]
MMKRSRGDRDEAPAGTSNPTVQQHLYLIFDDCDLGYTIRELNLPSSLNSAAAAAAAAEQLPPPLISLEAQRSSPQFFTAVGTNILATHPREDGQDILPVIDVRSTGIRFAPGELYPRRPIFLPVGGDDGEIFALDMDAFKVLSMKPLSILTPWWPQHEDHEDDEISDDDGIGGWSWRDLPMPTSFFSRMDVTSYAVGPDGQTILVSTADATFAFDTVCNNKVWEKRADWSLPFSGRAYFVHEMGVFVGIPKDANAYGHLCFCRWLLLGADADGDEQHDVWFSKDNLSNKGSSESHVVGTSLVYFGESSRFCIVECVRNGDDEAVMKWLEERGWEGQDHITGEEEEEGCPLNARCCLTTVSLTFDTNGVLTTAAAETAVRCYKVPRRASFYMNPAAFWL